MARLRNGVKTSMRKRLGLWKHSLAKCEVRNWRLRLMSWFLGRWKNGRLKKRSVFARLECGAEEAIRIFLILECFGWINSFFLFFVHLSPHLLHCIFSYYVHRFSWVFVLLNSGSQRFCNYSTWRRYGFVEFKNEDDADYAIKIMNMIRLGQNGSGLIGTTITANKSGTSGSPLFALHSFLFTYLSSVYGLGSVDEQTSPGTEAVTEDLMDAVDISSYFAACPCRLFGKPIRCNKSSQDKKTNEVRVRRPPHETSQSWEGLLKIEEASRRARHIERNLVEIGNKRHRGHFFCVPQRITYKIGPMDNTKVSRCNFAWCPHIVQFTSWVHLFHRDPARLVQTFSSGTWSQRYEASQQCFVFLSNLTDSKIHMVLSESNLPSNQRVFFPFAIDASHFYLIYLLPPNRWFRMI